MVFNVLQIRSPESNELKLQHAVKFDFQVVIGKPLVHYYKTTLLDI